MGALPTGGPGRWEMGDGRGKGGGEGGNEIGCEGDRDV